jgi:hypothetical protein
VAKAIQCLTMECRPPPAAARDTYRWAAQRATEAVVANSKQIAGLVGPTLVAMLVSEFPLMQPHPYDSQTPPVVYFSGVLMFVAGLGVVRSHNLWVRNWPVVVTLTGWFFLLLRLRMFAASQYQQAAAGTGSTVFMLLESVPLVIALIITYQGYRRPPQLSRATG